MLKYVFLVEPTSCNKFLTVLESHKRKLQKGAILFWIEIKVLDFANHYLFSRPLYDLSLDGVK